MLAKLARSARQRVGVPTNAARFDAFVRHHFLLCLHETTRKAAPNEAAPNMYKLDNIPSKE